MEWQDGHSDTLINNTHEPVTPKASANPWFTAVDEQEPANALNDPVWQDAEAGPSKWNGRTSSQDDPLKLARETGSHRGHRTTDGVYGLNSLGYADNEATRPSLSRLTSAARLVNGLDRLGLGNASTDSLSTQDEAANRSRRSLDELRKLSIKGKSRALDDNEDGALGENSLHVYGKEALLHMVEKGDSLIGIALLYGCTAQAIRTANKLWLNDPIQLRKSLYVPLEACLQPPSKEYEFTQKAGENLLHIYHRETQQGSTTTLLNHERPRSRMRSASLLQAALSIDRPLTPYHDETPSEQSSARSSFTQSRTAVPAYLADTNSDYGDSVDDLHSGLSAYGSTSPPGSAGLPMASSPRSKSLLVEKGTVQIVRMPASSAPNKGKGQSSARHTGAEQLVPFIDEPSTNEKPGSRQTIQAVSSASLLTPSSSSDRLSTLVPGLSGPSNLRMRPRSPFDNASTPNTQTEFAQSIKETDLRGSPLAGSAPAFPPRTRKISKDAVPTSSISSSTLPKSANKAFSYFGGLLAGPGSNNGVTQRGKSWLGVGDFEDEIELAKAYQVRRSSSDTMAFPGGRGVGRKTSRN